MSRLSKASPLKRKPAESIKPPTKTKSDLQPGNQEWPCLREGCDGHLAVRTRRDGKQYASCDQNDWHDPGTCKVTCSLLSRSKDHPHKCEICLHDVGGRPSIGFPTDEVDERGFKSEERPVCCSI